MERLHCRVFLQDRANDVALNAATLAVNDAQLAKTCLLTLFKIFFDDARDFLGLKRVEV